MPEINLKMPCFAFPFHYSSEKTEKKLLKVNGRTLTHTNYIEYFNGFGLVPSFMLNKSGSN